ncbi:flavodoxin family protein [Phytomonospora endophytica]|uniref:Multimeric flavodoxin WrbA n=1 Tax=Phytomonospora endophytica TaxID=714109 RepID=A0A841FQD5_9ACTN|nr:NAD(P)H-dependent oxidoreductase [Phytomonospora endophytica]MBB6037043.1 multimeric flavodoxin WrbA [Phytomonospora endophytica]GIG69413.1 flavodoxin [Phytomonospora endophytica]
MTTRKFVFILGSSRPGGNTEDLARLAARDLPEDAEQVWLDLERLRLPDFSDVRHAPGHEYAWPSGNEETLLRETLSATDLVIASPLYWYSVSASVKRYLDYWSGWLRVPGADFRETMAGKTMWGVSVVSDEDLSLAEPLSGTLRISAEYMGMRWGGTLLGFGNRPGDVLADEPSLLRAKGFFTG